MSKGHERIKIGISCGDLAGIGLEVILKVFSDNRMFEICTPIVYCPDRNFKFYKKSLGLENLAYSKVKSEDDANGKRLYLIDVAAESMDIEFGKGNAQTGKVAYLSLKQASEALAGTKTDVLITAPIDKKLIQSEAFNFKGHTEYLANYANVEDYLMFMIFDTLRIGVVTGHVPIEKVAKEITQEAIISKLRVIQKCLESDFSINKPKIAVLGLNPHAGDGGLLGENEQKTIIPAMRKAIKENILVFGPFAADGFFANGSYKNYDAVLAMYHDQGLIPFKTISRSEGVNFTAGLPIVRTSPDHGTAFDIAGKNMADPTSFRNAIYAAIDIFRERSQNKQLKKGALEKQS